MENIRVAVRIKPLEGKEKELPFIVENNSISIKMEKVENKYIFDNVFLNSSQLEIFDKIAKNAVEWVTQGYNSTIFTYGCSGSGKTYTLFGENENKGDNMVDKGDKGDKEGIIPRSCKLLFDTINSNDKVTGAIMKCSFLEIYREQLRDLINGKNDEKKPKLRYDIQGKVFVQDITEKYVSSSDEIMSVIKEGALQRASASTNLNNNSSRSHAVLTLFLKQTFVDGIELSSKLNLVDLAGSENVMKSEVQGINLLESQNINKSLSCLGNVIYALTEKGRDHIPYRDSKLTQLLSDSLGGNSKTIIVATISPSINNLSETVNTLKFGKRAKEIKNIPVVNRNESVAVLLTQIESLKSNISVLEAKCKEYETIHEKIVTNPEPNTEKTVYYISKCESLEIRNKILEKQFLKEYQRYNCFSKIFEKQRNLCKKVSKELSKEKQRNYFLNCELEKYKAVLDTVVSNINYEASYETLKLILSKINFKTIEEIDKFETESLNSQSLQEVEDVIEDIYNIDDDLDTSD